MPKIKNKFIFIVIVLILFIISIQFFISFTKASVDTNSYVVLIKWNWFLNENPLEIDKREELDIWDEVSTLWEESFAVIEWWDGSITRLWGDTNIIVNETYVSNDLNKINIAFVLLSWKTWSNITSFFSSDSYFKEYFNDIEAWVRWTVFSVNLEEDYVYSLDHNISLKTKDNKTYVVEKDKPFSITDLDFIDLKQFLETIKDKSFEKINMDFDKEYILWLKQDLVSTFKSNNPLLYVLRYFSPKYYVLYKLDNSWEYNEIYEIITTKLDDEDKSYLYEKILTYYQKLDFVTNDDVELFEKKILYKKILIVLADNNNKELLIKSTINDFNDIVSSDNYNFLEDIISILDNNKDILDYLKIDFSSMIDIDFMPEELKEIFSRNLDSIKNIFWDQIDFDIFSIDWVLDLHDKAKEKINDWLEKIVDQFKK